MSTAIQHLAKQLLVLPFPKELTQLVFEYTRNAQMEKLLNEYSTNFKPYEYGIPLFSDTKDAIFCTSFCHLLNYRSPKTFQHFTMIRKFTERYFSVASLPAGYL